MKGSFLIVDDSRLIRMMLIRALPPQILESVATQGDPGTGL